MLSVHQMKITLDFHTQLRLQLAGSSLVDTEAPALRSARMPSRAARGIISAFVLGTPVDSDLAGLGFAPPYKAIHDRRMWSNTAGDAAAGEAGSTL